MSSTIPPRTRSLMRLGGIAAVAGAVLAVAGNAVVLGSGPNAPTTVVSYPLSAHDFRLGQIYFAVTQALMTVGIFALVRSDLAGGSRPARIGALLAIVGFIITIPGELVLALVATARLDSPEAYAASSVFGVGVVIADIGLILFGVMALRRRSWPPPWNALPLTLGAVQLFIVTPVVLGAGFASLPAFAAITLQDALIALLGIQLLRHSRTAGERQGAHP